MPDRRHTAKRVPCQYSNICVHHRGEPRVPKRCRCTVTAGVCLPRRRGLVQKHVSGAILLACSKIPAIHRIVHDSDLPFARQVLHSSLHAWHEHCPFRERQRPFCCHVREIALLARVKSTRPLGRSELSAAGVRSIDSSCLPYDSVAIKRIYHNPVDRDRGLWHPLIGTLCSSRALLNC